MKITRKANRLDSFDELLSFAEKNTLTKSQRVLTKLQKKLFSRKSQKNLTHLLTYLMLKSNLKSVQIIKMLIKKKHFDEAMALIRMIIERCALALYSLENNLKVESIEKLNGAKVIGHLKRKFADVGKFYGYFSEIAHSKPDPSIHFWILSLQENKKNSDNDNEKFKEMIIILRCLLFFATEINFTIIKFLAKDYLNVKSYWELDKDNSWNYNPHHKSGSKLISEDLLDLYSHYVRTVET
ncbi:MAG: hypothetical protein PHO67_04000 [Candidatus Omnitrophica bacterium]|nr:hypothetical protein [Candidatus Omnitrophota bacterium]